ncbi:MAG: hypothetical protein KGL40_06635 [Rhodocyclaceae bacterium]|nr:hypothetical protein [Rhodocyclaceae bacterium]
MSVFRSAIASLRLSLAALLALLACGVVSAQAPLGNVAADEGIVTAQLDGYTISGIVSRLPGKVSFKYGIVLFPGHPSIMRLREEDGRLVFELQGNTLVRSRRLLLDEDTLVLTVDAPSDEWSVFSHNFRRGSRYGQDVRALLTEVMKRYPVADWTMIGHSEGAVSAYAAAVANLDLTRHVALVSALYLPTRNGPALSGLDWRMLSGRLLFVHHESDACQYTPYLSARQFAADTGSPLLTVRGGSGQRGDACRTWSAHGLPGMEEAALGAVKTWSRTGTVPATVGP